METVDNYSVDMLKKAAFVDELNNTLLTIPEYVSLEDDDRIYLEVVIEYFKGRIIYFENKYKK